MRVISQYRNFEGPCLQEEELMVLANGKTQVLQKGIWAGPFIHGDVTEWERRAAMEHWKHLRGLTYDEDPVWRLSSFDTDLEAQKHGWTAEEKTRYEEILRTSPSVGSDYIIVDRPRVEAPYPKWVKNTTVAGRRTLEQAVERAVKDVTDNGYAISDVVSFERQEKRRESEAIIAALEKLVVQEDEELVEA